MVCFVADALSIEETSSRIADSYPGLAASVRFLENSQLLGMESAPTGTYVFTDMIHSEESRRNLAILVERKLMEHLDMFRILNSPLSSGRAKLAFWAGLKGVPLTGARLKALTRPLLVRSMTELGESVAEVSDNEELSALLGERVLNGDDPKVLALVPPSSATAIALVYGDGCLTLAGNAPPTPTFINQFGLDVFGVEYSVAESRESATAIGDRLTDLFPRCRPNTQLSQAITEAVRGLDTVRSNKVVALSIGWEEMSKALKLSTSEA
jgi:hypothetical protein